MPNDNSGDDKPKRFRVGFSFAGEKREFVAKVARMLADRIGEDKILYDKFHEAEFARRDLGIYLPELYHKESDLVIVVDRKSKRLNSSHVSESRMPSSA